jgi:hypothetical protein
MKATIKPPGRGQLSLPAAAQSSQCQRTARLGPLFVEATLADGLPLATRAAKISFSSTLTPSPGLD